MVSVGRAVYEIRKNQNCADLYLVCCYHFRKQYICLFQNCPNVKHFTTISDFTFMISKKCKYSRFLEFLLVLHFFESCAGFVPFNFHQKNMFFANFSKNVIIDMLWIGMSCARLVKWKKKTASCKYEFCRQMYILRQCSFI